MARGHSGGLWPLAGEASSRSVGSPCHSGWQQSSFATGCANDDVVHHGVPFGVGRTFSLLPRLPAR